MKGDEMDLCTAVKQRLAPEVPEWPPELPTEPEYPCAVYADWGDSLDLVVRAHDRWTAEQAAAKAFILLNGWLPPAPVPRLRVAYLDQGEDESPKGFHVQLRVEPKHYLAA